MEQKREIFFGYSFIDGQLEPQTIKKLHLAQFYNRSMQTLTYEIANCEDLVTKLQSIGWVNSKKHHFYMKESEILLDFFGRIYLEDVKKSFVSIKKNILHLKKRRSKYKKTILNRKKRR